MFRLCMLAAVTLSLAFAPAPFPRTKKPESASARIVRSMESYRIKLPPAEGISEQNGFTVKELEPYLMSHLAGAARRLAVKTKAECVALLPYVKDRDCKIRFIAVHALLKATKAYPSGISLGWVLDIHSEGHSHAQFR